MTTCKCEKTGYHIHLTPLGTYAIFFNAVLQYDGFRTMTEAQLAIFDLKEPKPAKSGV